MKWTLNNQPVVEIPYKEGFSGFVYMIHFTDGTQYIGKKTARSEKSSPATKSGPKPGVIRRGKHVMRKEDGKIIVSKRDKIAARKRGITAKIEMYDYSYSEGKWQDYEGSSELRGDREILSKEILAWCQTSKALTYIEASILFSTGALFNEKFLNLNILGTFFDNVLEGEDFGENFYKVAEEK